MSVISFHACKALLFPSPAAADSCFVGVFVCINPPHIRIQRISSILDKIPYKSPRLNHDLLFCVFASCLALSFSLLLCVRGISSRFASSGVDCAD